MKYFPYLAAMLLVSGSVTCEAAESIFTDLDTAACSSAGEVEGGVVLTCPGLKGYPVTYKEGDLRPSVAYGPLTIAYRDGAFESFSAFGSVNTKVEWRVADRRPVAAILRFFISNADPATGTTPKRLKGQVLVISKVASPPEGESCVVGLVDALSNKDANQKARDVADQMAGVFRCGQDQPGWYGKRGALATDFNSSLPQP